MCHLFNSSCKKSVILTLFDQMANEDGGENTTLDRRPSLMVLQKMLREIPQSPFLDVYQSPDPSSSETSNQDAANYNPFHSSHSSSSLDLLENGATISSSTRVNHDNFLTSRSGSTSGEFDSVNLDSSENHANELFERMRATISNTEELLQDLDANTEASSGRLLDKPRVFDDPLWPSSKADNRHYSASTAGSSFFQRNGEQFSLENQFTSSTFSGSDADVVSPTSNAGSPIVKKLFRDNGGVRDWSGAETPDSDDSFGAPPGWVGSTPDVSDSAVRLKYSGMPRDVVLTTPHGSKHAILQPTPFNLARNLTSSPDSSPTEPDHVVKLTRRPPKPLPRSRPPGFGKPPVPEKSSKPENAWELEPAGPPKPPPKPFKPLTELVADPSAEPQGGKTLDSEDYHVLEDIVLIGQEKCVEDWPEDSPQLDPDFKPSGRFRLRRESMKFSTYSEGGRKEDQDDFGRDVKKKERKFSFLSRGSSKEKLSNDLKDVRSWTLPHQRKSSKEHFNEYNSESAKTTDGEKSWSEHKKKSLKSKVNLLLRSASTNVVRQHSASKDDDFHKKKVTMKESAMRWHSQEAMIEGSLDEEDDAYAPKGKKKLKMKLNPQKASSKSWTEHPQGAHGYTPAHVDSQDPTEEQIFGASENDYEDVEELKKLHSNSQEDVLQQRSFSAERLDGDAMDGYKAKKNKFKIPIHLPHKPKPTKLSPGRGESMSFDRGSQTQTSRADNYSDEDGGALSGQFTAPVVDYNSKPKKLKLKGFGKHKKKNKAWDGTAEDMAGEHVSEAAKAEWLAAQRDVEAGLEDGEGDGDTDSLMEWWNTVEQWDECPSDEEQHQDESQSFSILADKVNRGLRVFNKVFTERAEVFWQHVVKLHALADHLSTFHQKAKKAGISGGTTAAVGGVTAVAGLALAPFTLGISLIITAVGVGVATAGGIASASATISDNVNSINERKKVEAVLQEYEINFRDLAKILHFVNHGLYKLRGHPFLRSGTQHYSEDWEVRKAVQMIGLVDSPVMRAMEVTDTNLELVHRLHNGMDKYFMDSRDRKKKPINRQVVSRIREIANMLNNGIVELNTIREELQAATGDF
ncbi:uncharacterized protein si:cabz01007807.1 isoform X2 [Corythoichthys intestinalis]|uniref:uncharacterized protein si:cabz01007807.1 isoform X2 n=1 Tax=Corythoichthys intestinalis TaxID=161448 RepID=UPI0025A55398|nr:uncharacterized protein si:cabz01007807.1 isoform X2 [Corythoichthys intestinalis]